MLMDNGNYLVFREEPLSEAQIPHREEHNERTAQVYANGNINLALSGNNIYFVKPAKSYQEIFNEKLEAGEITIKGLKADASHYSEIIVAVNKDYWKDKSEEYIYNFFKTVNDFLVEKFGADKVVSSVVHCDEVSPDGAVNYHLHFVAIPTVEKKRYYSKRSKQYQALVEAGEKKISPTDERLYKSSECQVSHSKLFESPKDEQHRIQYSYSVWQDSIMKVLKEAGFTDIRRGVENQHAKHISVTQFKAMMERIEAKAEKLLPEVKAKPVDEENYLVQKDGLHAIYDLREQVSKEKATYDEAVDVLVETQKQIYNRQNEVYQVALQQANMKVEIEEAERLEEEAKRLREENSKLKSLLGFMKEKVVVLLDCFKKIIDGWVVLRGSEDAVQPKLIGEIDEQVKRGIAIIYNQPEKKNIQDKSER